MCATSNRTWMTPFLRQCFVTSGVALNMLSFGVVPGYSAVILPQLQRNDSIIPLDDSSGSWIASIFSLTQLGGVFLGPPLMARYGRRIACLASIHVMLIAWICFVVADRFIVLLIARVIQGISLGISLAVCSIFVGEYSSPKNRGMFLAVLSLAMSFGLLVVHTIGSYLSWKKTALVFSVIAFVDLLIALFSPESPSWLIEKGRYKEGKRIFRWFRGHDEDNELERMIEARLVWIKSQAKTKVAESVSRMARNKLVYVKDTVIKKEFYKPIIILVHLYAALLWAGISVLSAYIQDIIHNIVGKDVNVAHITVSVATLRMLSNCCAVYITKKVRRRTFLYLILLVIIIILITAGYTYAKSKELLPFDHPSIGITLLHLHMFIIAIGISHLPFIIAGELFPLEFKSLANGISSLFFAVNQLLPLKTFTFLTKSIGFHWTYVMYSGIVGYGLTVVWIMLPETKDKTLQEIEDEFKGKPLTIEELKSTQSLTATVY